MNTSDSDYITFRSSGKLEISGNIMSMLNYKTLYEEPVLNDYCFYKLFGSCEALTIAKELELPAKKLKPYCY
ncbi:MAG: hypothetical protein MJ224_00085 [archaeon]|nr:hypothetical protein [archaeon]